MRIQLAGWGATLYSGEGFSNEATAAAVGASASSAAAASAKTNADFERMMMIPPPLSREQCWSQLTHAAMTSMVVSLDLLALTRDLLVAPAYAWGLSHYSQLLCALEASHWHAFCFNENVALRLQLQQRGFMNRGASGSGSGSSSSSGPSGTVVESLSSSLPHLLEQEVMSMEQMLFTVYRLYCFEKHSQAGTRANGLQGGPDNGAESKAFSQFAETLVERLVIYRA